MTDNERRVRNAIIRLWSEHGSYTQREIARATKTRRANPLSQAAVRTCFTRWEANGSMQTQIGTNGVAGAAWSFNWSAPPGAALGDVVQAALTESTLPEEARRHLRTALRVVFDLPARCSDELILSAAGQVRATDLYEFPERVFNAYLEHNPKGRRTAWNLRYAVRRALRLGAQQNLVPVEFPRVWQEDPWEAAKWAYFPDNAPRLKRGTIRTYRSNWADLAREAKEFFTAEPFSMAPTEVTPDTLTQEMVDALARHLITRKGKRYLARQLRTVLNYVGRMYQSGPFAGRFASDELVWGYNGRVNAGYLVNAQGRGASNGDWAEFCSIFTDNGFSEEWQEFLIWYHEYSTLSHARILEDDRFPSRPAKRHLKARTLVKRVIGLRAWGFQAIRAVRDGQGLDPADITLEMSFGTYGPRVVRRLVAWWAARADRGEVTHASSDGLVGILKAGAMVARALYDKSRHERGLSVVDDKGKAIRVIAEEALMKTPAEEAYWRTYMECRNQIDALEEARRTSPDGHVNTTAKDIKRIIERTPPSYWEAIQDELLRRVREARASGETTSFTDHRIVTLAFLLGLMISTGFRISEVSHIRIGTDARGAERHYGPQRRRERRIYLPAVDRKNRRRHSAYLRERYCPVWLEEEYLERSRPSFLSRGQAPKHDWLIVDSSGRPYGCIEDDDPQKERDDIQHSERLADLRDWWIDQLMGVAADLGLTIPCTHGEFSPHVIRNVFGYLLYQKRGERAAANYLGDRIPSVRETYASCDGAHVDVSEAMLDGLSLIKSEVTEEDETDSGSRSTISGCGEDSSYHTELKELRADLKTDLITREEYERAKLDLNRRFGLAA